MFGLFKNSELKKTQKQHEALLTRAFQAQRNGDIRQYSELTAQAETLKAKLDELSKQQ